MTSYFLSLLIGLLMINAWMYFQQPNMTFFPMAELEDTPANWALAYEDVHFKAADGVALHGWYLPHTGSNQVLLFFHGNAGNISHRCDSLAIFHRLGLNVFIIDYRGYGQSEGVPSEQGLYRDAMAAWHYLVDEKGFAGNQVVIHGRSLGGAIATDLASKVRARGLILESTFSSARDFSRLVFPVLSRLVLMRYQFNSGEKISRINAPLLVMHSPDDEIVPFSLGEQLFKTASDPKQFYTLRGDHNSGYAVSQPAYEQAIRDWLQALNKV
ncbi:MAG: alpha/beta hydrolase [Gammaproteobacteria bacterium]|nr:alpha/beta hydrolase [Gammaproteobacteria bacterium]